MRPGRRLVAVFATTLLLSAVLLFTLEPLAAKLLLAAAGGSPAVWTTCMVFFQALLLAAYLYAHLVGSRLGLRAGIALHLGVLLLPWLALPIATLSGGPAGGADPTWWILGRLARTVGLPFFAVSTSAPLLQKWFSVSRHRSAGDPYFLYVASNLGSLVALLAYPLVLEPALLLAQQGRVWAYGYAALFVLTVIVAASVWRGAGVGSEAAAVTEAAPSGSPPRLAARGGGRLRWIALSLVPSSWLLGLTTYLATDLASVPLLWVVPLGLYLTTFVLAFAKRPLVPLSLARRVLPMGVLVVLLMHVLGVVGPLWITVPAHLITFFAGAMACHGELAERRPPPERLTDFYLCLSVGGVLGGLFNAVLVPALFAAAGPIERPLAIGVNNLELFEYPLAMIAACALALPRRDPAAKRASIQARTVWGVAAVFSLAGLVGLRVFGLGSDGPAVIYVFGLLVVVSFAVVKRPAAFVGALLVFLVATALCTGTPPLLVERGFFGVLRVTREGDTFQLRNGSTIHGMQAIEPERQRLPLTYYHPSGPLGQVFDAFHASGSKASVGVVGLGVGSIAAYAAPPTDAGEGTAASPGEAWTFFEIDPAVVRIAQDTRYFTFLRDLGGGGRLRIVVGDARLRLNELEDGAFGLLVLDAFSSDAVPAHLLTREALAIYARKLAPGGLLAFHVSSRHLFLAPVLGALAADASPPLSGSVRSDDEPRTADKYPSEWVALARSAGDLGPIGRDPRWKPLAGRPGARTWNDDYADVLGAFH